MRSRSRGTEPARFGVVRRRFELWRRTRQGRARIPERLWTSAVKLAATYGLCRTARTLGLDSNDSPAGPTPRRKTPARNASAGRDPGSRTCIAKPPQRNPAMTFVELSPLERSGLPECIVELEDPRGAKMRIRLTGHQNADVVTAVSQIFFGAGS